MLKTLFFISFISLTSFVTEAKACQSLSVEKVETVSSTKTLLSFKLENEKSITLIDDDGFATAFVIYQYWTRPYLDEAFSLENKKSESELWKIYRDQKLANIETLGPVFRKVIENAYWNSILSDVKATESDTIIIRAMSDFIDRYEEGSTDLLNLTFENLDQTNLGSAFDLSIRRHKAYQSTDAKEYKISDNNLNNPIGSGLSYFSSDLPYFSFSKCGHPPVYSKDFWL